MAPRKQRRKSKLTFKTGWESLGKHEMVVENLLRLAALMGFIYRTQIHGRNKERAACACGSVFLGDASHGVIQQRGSLMRSQFHWNPPLAPRPLPPKPPREPPPRPPLCCPNPPLPPLPPLAPPRPPPPPPPQRLLPPFRSDLHPCLRCTCMSSCRLFEKGAMSRYVSAGGHDVMETNGERKGQGYTLAKAT